MRESLLTISPWGCHRIPVLFLMMETHEKQGLPKVSHWDSECLDFKIGASNPPIRLPQVEMIWCFAKFRTFSGPQGFWESVAPLWRSPLVEAETFHRLEDRSFMAAPLKQSAYMFENYHLGAPPTQQ